LSKEILQKYCWDVPKKNFLPAKRESIEEDDFLPKLLLCA
jgi:hypothetical protein